MRVLVFVAVPMDGCDSNVFRLGSADDELTTLNGFVVESDLTSSSVNFCFDLRLLERGEPVEPVEFSEIRRLWGHDDDVESSTLYASS